MILYYAGRRVLGVLAALLDRYEKAQAERQARKRAHPEGTRGDQL